ncbi:MAG: hypothetical protein V1727_00320 [Candidatus Omnitrophota bacterium]
MSRLRNNRGIAFLIVIGMVFMLAVLSAAVLMLAAGHFGTSFRQIKHARAYYAAEAGLVHALAKCRLGVGAGYDFGSMAFPYVDPSPPLVQDPDYSYTAKIVILLPGTNLALGPDEVYVCPGTIASSYCVFSRVDY